MRRLDQALAWLVVLLGIRFALVAPREFQDGSWPWATGFWLASTAVLFVACGSMHLVRIRYGAVAPGLKVVCALMSIAIALLQLVAGVVGGEAAPASVVAILLLVSSGLSVRPEAGLAAG
jgi:hypothetical protein